MSSETASLFTSALALPEQLRADLATQLLHSLAPPHAADPASAEYAAEVQRRSAEIDSGEVQMVPWSEVRAKIRAKLEGGESS